MNRRRRRREGRRRLPPPTTRSHRLNRPRDPRARAYYRYRARSRRGRAGLKVAVALGGVLTGLLVGAIAFFTVGEAPAVILLLAVSGFGFLMAASAPVWLLGLILVAEMVASTAAGLHIADQAMTIVRALTTVEGPVDPADEADLAAAEARLTGATDDGGFRIELHEDEITAVIQDGLQEVDAPLRRISVDIVDGSQPDDGKLDFVGEFKAEDVTVRGTIVARLVAGAVQIDVVDVELGSLDLPGVAAGAIEEAVDDLLGRVSDINDLLAAADADVQSISLGNDRLVITGTQGSEALLTSTSLLSGLQEQAAAAGGGDDPPPERLGPGDVDGRFEEGSVYYLALGDSLAANVGVDEPRDGYVSRLHRQLELEDGRDYGLNNLGISGETSGTLIRSGQLDEALAFLRENRVAYITIDIGANDLLGHLGSDDCADSTAGLACRQRIESSFASYEDNIEEIFRDLRDAAPDATIVFVRAYNPFSLGIAPDVGFEAESSETLDAFNDVAAALARDFDVVVADAFTPMQNTAAVTTHMFDSPPDIHPKAIGYDIIAAAIVDALR